MKITNEQVLTAAKAAINSLELQGCHVHGNLKDRIYSGLWDLVNDPDY